MREKNINELCQRAEKDIEIVQSRITALNPMNVEHM